MRILMTGFEPFGRERINPSWEAVFLLPDEIGGAQVSKRRLPVTYAGSEAALWRLMDELRPDFVIATGQAGGRSAVSIECCTINMDHADAPDNAGETRRYLPIAPSGAAAYFTSAPVQRIVDAVCAENLRCAPSFSAGTYVCNHVYYRILESTLPAQVSGGDRPSMELSDIARALEIIARMIAEG